MSSRAGRSLAVVKGVVSRGDQIGRTLGFPTANIACPRAPVPPGVYASRVRIGPSLREGASYWGPRPTIGRDAGMLESHIFDFEADLYGERITVMLVARVRPDVQFTTLEALRAQMVLDCRAARRLLAAENGDEAALVAPRPVHWRWQAAPAPAAVAPLELAVPA